MLCRPSWPERHLVPVPMAVKKTRLDDLCVARGLFDDVEQAQRPILAGEVYVDDEPLYSRAARIPVDSVVRLKSHGSYVSRGGEKLAGALDVFGFDPTGLVCLDCGASTGGFTDCLLKRGAKSVCAVDVGYGQFAWQLRNDERVRLFERTNINLLDPEAAGAPFDLAVADISFAPLHSYIGAVRRLLSDEGTLITLVKPQFEAHRSQIGSGGLVLDAAVHEEVLIRALGTCRENGLEPQALTYSPITGAKGNIEFLLMATCGAAGQVVDVAGVVARAHNAHDVS